MAIPLVLFGDESVAVQVPYFPQGADSLPPFYKGSEDR
jgi:hypothetical protein